MDSALVGIEAGAADGADLDAVECFIRDWVESCCSTGKTITPGFLRSAIRHHFQMPQGSTMLNTMLQTRNVKEKLGEYLHQLGLEPVGGAWKKIGEPTPKRRRVPEGSRY